ncbi:hypothetical protein C5E06_09830 [Pseudoclavibacter sp. RFBI5]|nr:hypothetical protein C5E06_09830 [Pseudoclavibacter sp. RFBI5]
MNSTAIAVTAGVYQLYLGKNVTIPASGSVQLGLPQGMPTSETGLGRVFMDAQIAGISGKLVHQPEVGDPSKTWVFTRDSPGTKTNVSTWTPIHSLDKPRPGVTSIFWVGSNNLGDPAQVKADTTRLVNLHKSTSSAPYYVVQVPPAYGGDEHPNAANRKNINAWILSTYGQRTIPLADYLANGALQDAGLVPTLEDRNSIARGVNPRALWMSVGDLTHMNSTGYAVAAKYLASFVRDGNTYSAAIKRFDATSTFNVAVNGPRVTVSGHAFDHSDLYQSINVGITVDGAWNATFADLPSRNLYAYGVPGRHGYSMTLSLAPGAHKICTVAVGFGAGQHHYPPCKTVHIEASAAPVGDVAIANGNNSRLKQFYGWTYAPGDHRLNLPVAIIVDGKWHHVTPARDPSSYLSGVKGNHAFWSEAAFSPGKHTMCAVAIESPSNMTGLGCKDFVIK